MTERGLNQNVAANDLEVAVNAANLSPDWNQPLIRRVKPLFYDSEVKQMDLFTRPVPTVQIFKQC